MGFFCAVFHRLLGLGSNLNAFHSSPPLAASSSAALNLSFACRILRNELYLLTLPPHQSHWTLLLNRAEISRKAATLVPQNELWFSLFVSHYVPVSFPHDSKASSYNRDDNSNIYVENRVSQHFSMISLDPCNHAVRTKQFYSGYSPCFLNKESEKS